jgi:hypothetical protein
MIRSLFLLLCLAVALAGCGDGDSAETIASTAASTTTMAPPTTAPVAADPLELTGSAMPTDLATAVAVLAAMPDEIAGRARQPEEYQLVARYDGGGVNVSQVLDEPFAARSMIEETSDRFTDEPGSMVEASQLDPDGDLLFFVGSFSDEGGEVHMAQWCEPEGELLFTVDADSPEFRAALLDSFWTAVAEAPAAGPVQPTEALERLEALRAAIPSTFELESFMEVQGLSVDTSGGPGVAGFMFEHTELTNLVGGYQVMVRHPRGVDSGWLGLILFDTEADAAAALDAARSNRVAEDAEFVRAEFDVTDLLIDGDGTVMDPEPDSHFTTIVGHTGPVVVTFLVFHDADDDRIEAARSVVFEVAEWIEGADV